MCDHHLWDEPDGLACTRTDHHDPTKAGGHIYRPASNLSDETTEDQ